MASIKARRRTGSAWLLWIVATTLTVTLAAIIDSKLRIAQPFTLLLIQPVLSWIAALDAGLIVSTTQWLVLRHYRVPARWWIPASVAATVATAEIIGPLVIRLMLTRGASTALTFDSGLRLVVLLAVTSGIVVGGAQSLVLRHELGSPAWIWIAATVLGGILAAAVTHSLSMPLLGVTIRLGLPAPGLIASLAMVGGFLVSACQAPVLVRLLQHRGL